MNTRATHLLGPILATLLPFASGAAQPVAPGLIIHDKDRFEFTYRVTLPELKQAGRLWLPMAKSDAFQTVEVLRMDVPPGWRLMEDDSRENWVFTAPAGPAESGRIFEITYQVARLEKQAYPGTEPSAEPYLHPERLVPRHESFDKIARRETAGLSNDLERGRALYRHTLEWMRYDKSGQGWGRGDALYACDARAGNCTDFHAYFIALCRSLHIPARFAIGFTIPADSAQGSLSGYHCWAEFLAGGEWIPVDISEADKHPELAEYYFGHHPANRLELSRGRDLKFSPGPSNIPINFLVYPILEVAGQPVPVRQEFWFQRKSKGADAEAP